MRTFKFLAEPYPCWVFVGISDDFQALAKRWGISPLAKHLEQAEAFYMSFSNGDVHLFFRPDNPSWAVAHEVSHMIDMVFDFAGVKQPDTETRAYLLSTSIKKIYRKWPKNAEQHEKP